MLNLIGNCRGWQCDSLIYIIVVSVLIFDTTGSLEETLRGDQSAIF